jgi:hypothetical protein
VGDLESRAGVGWFDRVTIRTTPLTEAAGIAGHVGTVYGLTTPSLHLAGVEIIGEPRDDVALNFQFDDLGQGVWIGPDLVQYLDHGPGTTAQVGDRTFIRTADGEWQPESGAGDA